MICLISQNPSIVPQLVELLSSSLSNAEGAALILSKCCQVKKFQLQVAVTV